MNRLLWLTLVVLAAVACGGGPEAEPIPDDRIGLVEADVFEVPTPPPVQFAEAAPGDASPLPRPTQDAPPIVPHAVADFLPITRDDNYCLACHGVDEKVEGGPTPVPASHYTDLRNAPDQAGEDVVGARWNCIACHVARTDAQPLVANSFGN